MIFETKKQLSTHIQKFCHVNNFLHENQLGASAKFDVDAYVARNIQQIRNSQVKTDFYKTPKAKKVDMFVLSEAPPPRATNPTETKRLGRGTLKASRILLIDNKEPLKPKEETLMVFSNSKGRHRNDDSLSYDKLKQQNNNNISVLQDYMAHTKKKIDFLRKSKAEEADLPAEPMTKADKENQPGRANDDDRFKKMQDELDRLIREKERENRDLENQLARTGPNQQYMMYPMQAPQKTIKTFNAGDTKFLELEDLKRASSSWSHKKLKSISRRADSGEVVRFPHHPRKFIRREFKYDDFIDENILGNYTRHHDLNIHERYLNFISASEIDNLRILERTPQDTDLYKFKLEQFKESSTAREEIKKLVHEQYLREIKRRYDVVRRDQDKMFENMNWVDEYRRKIIGDRVKLDLMPNFIYDYNDYINNGATMNPVGGPLGAGGDDMMNGEAGAEGMGRGMYGDDYTIRDKNAHRGYIPQEGFILFYDYEVKMDRSAIDSEIPREDQRLRIMVSLVCEGEVLVHPFEMGYKELSEESPKTLWSILKDKTHFNNVFVNDETLILFEVQIVGRFRENDQIKDAMGKSEKDLVDEDNMTRKHRDDYGFKNKYRVDYGLDGQVHDDILADRKNKVFVSKDYNEKLLVNLTKFNANYDYNDQDHGYEVRREGNLKVIVIGWTQLGRLDKTSSRSVAT